MTHPLEKFLYCPCCGSKTFVGYDRKSCRCADCGFHYYANAAAAVAAVIYNAKGEVLFSVRAFEPAKSRLDLPGGFVDMHESAEQALQRELKEELGIDTNIRNFRYLFSLPNRYPYSNITVHTLDMFFAVRLDDNATLVPADDVESARFIPIEKVNIDDIGLDSIRTAISMLKKMSPAR